MDAQPPVSARRARLYRVPVLGVLAYLIWPPRTRPPSLLRRTLSWTAAVVAVYGLGMMLYPAVGHRYPAPLRIPIEKGIEWSNVLSDLQSNRIQHRLARRFATQREVILAEGSPVTRLRIPKLGVDTIVVEGITEAALKAGAGHYPGTPLPGQKGNVAIAGHRTTYGRPFNRVDELRPGDQILLTTPVGTFTYEVERPPWITNPSDWTVIAPTAEPVLTLTSCHPKGSARQRIIVRAKLVRSEPVRARS